MYKRQIQYITNPDKTDQCVLVDHFNCDPGFAYQQMMNTKRRFHKTDGRQCYHIIQSFKPDEISPELAHEIAKRFAAEHLQGYEAVIGTHVDKGHIHSHIVFNSVNADTGIKYHSTLQNYYQQIRGISDRLCEENGLSVILQGEKMCIRDRQNGLPVGCLKHAFKSCLKECGMEPYPKKVQTKPPQRKEASHER